MTVRSYILAATPESIRGKNPLALRPRELFDLLQALDGVKIVYAEMSDLWNIRATDDGARAIKQLIAGWQLLPAPGDESDALPETAAPAGLAQPPLWAPDMPAAPQSPLADARPYLLTAGPGATSARAMQEFLRSVDGVRVIDDALPNEWLVEATDEARDTIKNSRSGWTIRPHQPRIPLSSPRPF